jgi:AraC-like DNA-binding protein
MFWYCEGYEVAHRKERVLPNGTFQLVIQLSEGYIRQWNRDPNSEHFFDDSAALIVGVQSQYSLIDTAGLKSMAGVLFRPGCAQALIGVPSHEFYNRDIPLEQIWGRTAIELRSRLQEAAGPREKFRVLTGVLTERLGERWEMQPAVSFGLREFQNAPQISSVLEVAREAGLSRRHFAQVFREQVGLTPKLYCRLVRFQQVVKQVRRGEEVDWADVALSCGYYDQAHLGHDFREFSGISPGLYANCSHLWRNHVPIP